MEVSFDFKGDPTGAHITNCKYLTKGGFPIEIETQISKLMTYIAKLYVISLLILVSISIGNPPIGYQSGHGAAPLTSSFSQGRWVPCSFIDCSFFGPSFFQKFVTHWTGSFK